MRSRSALWEQLSKRGRFELQTKAVINGTEYTAISAPVIDRALMSSPLSVGECNSASLALSILTDDEISSASPIVIQGRVTDGTNYSEWKPFGTFFINQRDTSYEGLVTVSCYDAMRKASQSYVNAASSTANWPKTMAEVVAEVAYRIGVTLDSRTVINTGDDYMVPYPTGLTMLQVLGYIGACHGGNWIITEENKLRLVPLVTSPDETFFVIDPDYEIIQTDDGHNLIHDIQTVFNTVLPTESPGLINVPAVLGQITTGTPVTVTGVSMEGEDDESYTAGSDSGAVIALGQNPYATTGICDALLALYEGLVYSPYTASNAIYDPATELGDQVKIGEKVFSVIMTETLTLDLGFRANISAPNSEELSDEYPYLSEVKQLRQTAAELNAAINAAAEQIAEAVEVSDDVASLQAVLQAEITRASGVESELSDRIDDEETRAKAAEQANADNITALGGRMTTAEGNITSYGTRISNLESASSGASGDISGLASRVTTVENGLGAASDAAASAGTTAWSRIKNAETDIDNLESLVSGHATRILALEGTTGQHTTDIADLDSRLDDAEDDIDALEDGLGTSSDTAAPAGTTAWSRIKNAEDDIDNLESGLGTASDTADSAGTTAWSRLKNAEDEIDALQATLNNATTGLTALWNAVYDLMDRIAALDGGADSGRTQNP